ncbi:MAG TPA: methylenetetrahydrofolate--tRNA-(uracil(54)-C(5))-methyltransferase (FADH(2)-oxidizing) TrmFO [Desulfobulbaceae bacterium]|nr:methylenetetrahydrofolate--tRNA-(uracil(54)-C(5))-methyltransferase (FADH(2)-oxidizing) TrmFO [Desulfobulbaceae bacterium]
MSEREVLVIGGGLAGCEASWQAAKREVPVRLVEMKPRRFSPAHESRDLAELVCSNSLRSNEVTSAVGLLKEEMRRLGSLIIQAADETAVPAGKALAVDRQRFAERITRTVQNHDLITVVREEVLSLPPSTGNPVILATGPLTSSAMAESLAAFTGAHHLAFYDAIAPIVTAESLDMEIIYRKSRWDDDGPGDYLNCPLDQAQYEHFISLLAGAQTLPLREFEDPKYFEGCLPVEVMLARGPQTLRFGPMKPVGLMDPRNGKIPYAVVQLRAENLDRTMYNMVGFQTKLTYPEQKRVFRAIPGLAHAEFARLGSIHRNTFVCAPEVLQPSLQTKVRPDLFLAGQLSGVEGYVESAAMGLLAGINAARMCQGRDPVVPPPDTAHGALIHHLTASEPRHFQPSNVTFGLFPQLTGKVKKSNRGEKRAEQALASLTRWASRL